MALPRFSYVIWSKGTHDGAGAVELPSDLHGHVVPQPSDSIPRIPTLLNRTEYKGHCAGAFLVCRLIYAVYLYRGALWI